MSVTRGLSIEMTMNSGLAAMLSKDGCDDLQKRVLQAAATFIAGQRRGGGQPPIPKHFTRNNVKHYGFAPLSPVYAAWKRRKVGNKPILVFSGAWKKAATKNKITEPGKKGTVRVSPQRPPHYAKYLEHGTKKMPARPAYTLNDDDRRATMKFLEKAIPEIADGWVKAHEGNMVSVVS
jgi:hypothetical protein